MVLIQSVHNQTTNNPQPGQPSTEAITAQIIAKQNLINEIIEVNRQSFYDIPDESL
jgi:hypothetical protein